MTAAPLGVERREEIASLGELLAAAGYTGPAIQERLGTANELLARPADAPAHLKRLEGDDGALATLIRLFVLLASAAEEDVDRVLAPLGTAGLEQLGLITRREAGRVVAAVRLIPHDTFVIASDLSETKAEGEHVPGVQRPSNTLANLTVRRPVERALDVGTGNGIQALLVARHAEHVVATDVSKRALTFAAFNCALNGVENVELRQGSFLEPVAGERFDLVVANPPYVISPETSFVFRDSGLGRDRVSAELVAALPDVLADGGFASVMVSWIPSGEDMTAVPRRWLEGSGCDAWLLHTQTDDALRAAAGWNRDAPSTEEFSERMERWLEYYRVEGIEKIAYGTIVLRRRTAAHNWLRTSMLPQRVLRPAGHHLERLFSAQDVLERAPSDDLLLQERFVVAADVELEQRLGQESGRWAVRGAELQLDGGLGFTAGLDEYSTKVVTGLDPARPLGATLGEAAGTLDVDPAEFAAAGAALIRQLLELGFVVAAGRKA